MNRRDPVIDRLAGLPQAEVPAQLWARIDRARAARVRRRQLGGVSALAVLAVALVAPSLRSPPPVPAPEPAVVRAPQAAHELRAIDRALQAAYDRGASPQEITSLWAMREALLAHDAPAVLPPTRI